LRVADIGQTNLENQFALIGIWTQTILEMQLYRGQ